MAQSEPAGPVLPEEPEVPASLEDAQVWVEIYDRYLRKVGELARENALEGELGPWIARCARRRLHWARARDRLQRLEDRRRAG